MAKFAKIYPDETLIVQRGVAQLPWRHNIVLMEKIKDDDQRTWYIAKAIENGWTRDILVHQIESNLYRRQGKAKKITNFEKVLAAPQSELAVQTIKDPYIFDFITAKEGILEREIESELIKNVTKLLLELGTGFAFIGNQYHLEVSGRDFYIDLLFYNLTLRCYVVIELKTGEFEPEYAGKLNFYLSAVDDILKTEQDNPSIGILLCKTKDNLIAEYALKDMTKPIGVSEYKISDKLPKKYKNALPSVDDIKNRILGEDEIKIPEGNR
jgi:predicted nuclease of restriction endonuclease-like (RecB) superfamily